MLVTCFYDIYNNQDKINSYLNLFNKIALSGIPITVFTHPSFVKYFENFPPSVNVIYREVESFELYSIAMNYKGELPLKRNYVKDTQEFLALMNTKIECILNAHTKTAEDETFIWIDFGILKIIKNIDMFINKLRDVNNTKYNKITIPGCWRFGTLCNPDNVNWRFCGGVIVIPRQHVQTFFDYSKIVLTEYCQSAKYKLTWETNIWNVIESLYAKDIIQWYSADHNDSILLNIDSSNQ